MCRLFLPTAFHQHIMQIIALLIDIKDSLHESIQEISE